MTPVQLLGLKVAAAALAVGLAAGGWGAHQFYKPRLALALAKSDAMATSIRDQNEAITRLQAESINREAAIKAAMADAEKYRVEAERAAQEILTLQRPQGVSACDAASALIRKELRK